MSRADVRLARDPVGALSSACHGPLHLAWDRLDDALGPGLAGAAESAAEAHQNVVEATGLCAEQPEEARVRSERLLEYGRSVASDVIDPLRMTLQNGAPTSSLGRLFADAIRSAHSACDALPSSVSIAWPADALEVGEYDGVVRRTGKLFARRVSQARHSGQLRPVPVRSFALHHLVSQVAPGQHAGVRAAARAWSSWMVELERLLAEWSDCVIPVLLATEVGEEAEGEDGRWVVVGAASRALGEGLSLLATQTPHAAAAVTARQELTRARAVLQSDVGVVGSFMLGRFTTSPRTDVAVVTGLDARTQWDSEVVARLRLHLSLFAILSGSASIQARLVARLRDECVGAAPSLEGAAGRLNAIAGSLEGVSAEALPGALEAARASADEALQSALASLPTADAIELLVREGADSTVEALLAMAKQVPSSLTLHPVGAPPLDRQVGNESRSLALQEMARQAFDALRVERIRVAATSGVEALCAVGTEARKLPDVVAFGFEAAAQESESDPAATPEDVAALVREALHRTAEALRVIPSAYETAIEDLRDGVAEEMSEGCEALFERAGARRVQARILAAQSLFSNLRMRLNEALGPPLDQLIRAARVRWMRLRRSAFKAWRWASGLFATEATAKARSSRTVRALARAYLEGGAPLVYQRLFSLEPITDPSLMAGRDREVSELLARWGRWKREDGIPNVVVGRPGSGVTSLLNVVVERLREDGARLAMISLRDRVFHEAQLTRLLAEELGLPVSESLDELAQRILRDSGDSVPNAVALDGLEHVYLRAPGGTDLTERLLTFMSETEPRVFWMAGVTTSAWQLVRKSEPTAVSQLDPMELAPLTPNQLREAITKRHDRSGLQVRYVEPAEGRRLLKRRLRRMRATQARQDLLAIDFFDRLHRASLGTLRLALYQWLQAAEFDTGDGEVRMHSVERPDFSVLEMLDLTQNFTLKAFLEHGTLTLGAHDAVFRIPRQESYQIFESLGNRHLIEPTDPRRGDRAGSEIIEGLRYRVPPLLTGAVIAHLERRNLIH